MQTRIMECLIDHAFTLKDYENMVESKTKTNNIVSFGFLDELKYWNIEKDMVASQRLDKMATTTTKQIYDQSEPLLHKSRITTIDK
jgi:putative lipase involved disintegration of autophagic bodies